MQILYLASANALVCLKAQKHRHNLINITVYHCKFANSYFAIQFIQFPICFIVLIFNAFTLIICVYNQRLNLGLKLRWDHQVCKLSQVFD